jgi:hypothetical protein
LLENIETKEAVGYLEIGAYTKEQLFTYDKVRDGILTERSVLSDAKREGVAEGLERGRRNFAAACLKKGMSPEDIKELTGLCAEEIRDLA